MSERKDGFWWVRVFDEWTVAQVDGARLHMIDWEDDIKPDEFGPYLGTEPAKQPPKLTPDGPDGSCGECGTHSGEYHEQDCENWRRIREHGH